MGTTFRGWIIAVFLFLPSVGFAGIWETIGNYYAKGTMPSLSDFDTSKSYLGKFVDALKGTTEDVQIVPVELGDDVVGSMIRVSAIYTTYALPTAQRYVKADTSLGTLYVNKRENALSLDRPGTSSLCAVIHHWRKTKLSSGKTLLVRQILMNDPRKSCNQIGGHSFNFGDVFSRTYGIIP